MRNRNVQILTFTAIAAALSAVLMFFEFPLPLLPPFLKLDFSTVPLLFLGYLYGPVPAIAATLVKELVHLPFSFTGGVGEIADFLMSICLILPSSLFYRSNLKGKFIWGSISGVAGITVAGMLANKFLLIPAYSVLIMPVEAIVSLCQSINPAITSIDGYIVFGAAPFNLIKGLIIIILSVVLIKMLQKVFPMDKKEKKAQTPASEQ